ncbi:MAG: hypothetical protein OHK0029_00670 [Armatimonadaceae bacterium]
MRNGAFLSIVAAGRKRQDKQFFRVRTNHQNRATLEVWLELERHAIAPPDLTRRRLRRF